MLQIYNTLSRQKEEYRSLTEGKTTFYTCGPTVYNYAHIGNFRAYLAADTLRRWLTYGEGQEVQWTLNITDVDDKTIRDSRAEYPELPAKEALQKFTRSYEEQFFLDLEALSIPKEVFHANPRATEYMEAMQELIRKIHAKGFAKIIDGSVFFDVKKWAAADKYGKLLNLDLSALKTGTRSLADEIEKEDLADFALWKAAKTGEPAWDFRLDGQELPGRPGWHIECSAMEKEIFDLPFDIHSGGVDLIFPHHEDEIAQSKCGYGIEPTNYWMHNEHLLVDGKKMSKSLGNFYTLRDLVEKGHRADSIRYFLVMNHYRSKLNLTEEGLQSAANALEKIRHFLRSLQKEEGKACAESKILALVSTAKKNLSTEMQDDLMTPRAMAVVFGLLQELKHLEKCEKGQQHIVGFFLWLEHILGVPLFVEQEERQIPTEILDLAQQRQDARAVKDFALADELRDAIAAEGYTVLDSPDGFELAPLT